ncbi:Trm112 family protein [Nocardioides zeae]
MSASIDPTLRRIVVCPNCRGELVDGPAGTGAGDELVCVDCGYAYPVRDGIPVLLVDEARRS